MKLLTIAASVLLASAISTQAATITSSAGLDLRADATENAGAQAFAEKSDVAVGAGQVTVDFLVGTNLSVGDTEDGLNNFAGGAMLGAGSYDSYLLHFDPIVTSGVTNFTVDFGVNIVGLILSNSGTQTLLNRTDATFGNAAFFDQTGGRRAESNDSFTLSSATSVTFNFYAGAGYTDNVRILTEVAPVPLPASLPLLLAAFGGLGLARRRRT